MRFQLSGLALAFVASTSVLAAQDSPRWPISIGNYPTVNGLRINFRDDNGVMVNGVNLTLWSPYEGGDGKVRGLALGLPLTGAGDISGVATGVFGVGASRHIRGLTLAPIGAGAGDGISGIGIAGVGLGSGGSLHGIMIGGVGAGSGGDITGIMIGGVGAGAGGNIRGIALGGIGVGGGGNATGILIGGVGAGVGGNLTGLAIGGIGVGSGGRIKGVGLGGIGVGAPRLDGFFSALAVGGERVDGIVIAPALFKIPRDGSFTGGSISAVNHIRGTQRGITIGVFNYARDLNGLQLGLINVVAHSAHPFLPILNWGSGRD